MRGSYHNYCKYLFDDSYSDNYKRYWSLIKSLRKDYSNIATLNVNSKCVAAPIDKAGILNNYFLPFYR